MDELLQLLKDANELRREGEPQASIDSQIAELTQGRFANHAALSAAVREQATSHVAQRRQEQMARDLAPEMLASTGPLESAASGATLGLSPIVGGLASAVGNPLHPIDAFVEGREHAKARIAAHRINAPIEAAVEELGGGLASIPLTAAAAPLKWASQGLSSLFRVAPAVEGMAPSTWNLIRTGAAHAIPAAAVYGAANAPDLQSLPSETVKSAGVGGVLGGTLGIGVPLAMTGGELLANRSRAFFRPGMEANRQVMQQLAKVLNPNRAEDLLSEAEHLRPGQAMVGDANPVMFGAAMRRTPNAEAVADRLAERAKGGGERLAQSAEASAGFQPGRAPNAILASEQGRRGFNAISRNFYQPLQEANSAIPVAERPALREALQNPRVVEAIERVTGKPVDFDPVVPGLGRRLSELPAPARRQLAGSFEAPTIPMTALQEAENDLGRLARNLPEGSNYTADNVKRAQLALREAMRKDIPGFAKADDQWQAAIEVYGPADESGGTGLLGAFAQGAKARTLDPIEMRQQLAALQSEEARSAYRMGLLSDIAGDLRGAREGVNAARLATTQGTQTLEPHLQEAFGTPQAMRRFLREAQVEDFFRRSREGFGGGSQTNPRGSYEKTLFPNDVQRNVFRRLLDQFKSGAVTIPDEQLAQGYERALTAQGDEAYSVLDQIRQAQRTMAQAGPRMQSVVRSLAPAIGGGGQEATKTAEWLALMALINGGKRMGGFLSTDRGY